MQFDLFAWKYKSSSLPKISYTTIDHRILLPTSGWNHYIMWSLQCNIQIFTFVFFYSCIYIFNLKNKCLYQLNGSTQRTFYHLWPINCLNVILYRNLSQTVDVVIEQRGSYKRYIAYFPPNGFRLFRPRNTLKRKWVRQFY